MPTLDENKLLQSYEGIAAKFEAIATEKERDPKDPFGLADRSPETSFEVGKACAERMVKFFELLISDFNLSPAVALYTAELASLNILNAKNIPIPQEEQKKARKAAFDYYSESVKNL